MGLIKVNYDKTYQQAHKLQEAVRDSETACRQIDIALQQASSHWSGEAQKQFEMELRAWKKEQQSIQREIEALARSIRAVAEEFEEAEKRIASAIAAGDNVS